MGKAISVGVSIEDRIDLVSRFAHGHRTSQGHRMHGTPMSAQQFHEMLFVSSQSSSRTKRNSTPCGACLIRAQAITGTGGEGVWPPADGLRCNGSLTLRRAISSTCWLMSRMPSQCWRYQKYAPENTELEKIEHEAREVRIGLWADPQPVPPPGVAGGV